MVYVSSSVVVADIGAFGFNELIIDSVDFNLCSIAVVVVKLRVPRGGGWGEAYSSVACLSHLTIDHVSLSRRSTVPTPNQHLQKLGAHHVFSSYYIENLY